MTSISDIGLQYLELGKLFNDDFEFIWCDIRSAEGLDAYLYFFLHLKGKLLCFEGRKGSSWYEQNFIIGIQNLPTKIINLNQFLGGKEELRKFFFQEGKSGFYPDNQLTQDLCRLSPGEHLADKHYQVQRQTS